MKKASHFCYNFSMRKILSYFTRYEKIWFFSISILAIACTFLFPEDEVNGVNGWLVMALYLADTLLNVLCELLISKQSKWNFLVSLGVEAAEIAVCVVMAERWTTFAVTILFWIPIDIISFVNWNRHADEQEKEITEVRKLTGKQHVIVLCSIALWTIVAGFVTCYVTENILPSDFFGGNRNLEMITCYLDACVAALGIANGVFIWLRYREQWIAWYAYAILEMVLNIIAIAAGHPGQSVLLILKLGYLTNTTYGYITWSKYINSHSDLLTNNGN